LQRLDGRRRLEDAGGLVRIVAAGRSGRPGHRQYMGRPGHPAHGRTQRAFSRRGRFRVWGGLDIFRATYNRPLKDLKA